MELQRQGVVSARATHATVSRHAYVAGGEPHAGVEADAAAKNPLPAPAGPGAKAAQPLPAARATSLEIREAEGGLGETGRMLLTAEEVADLLGMGVDWVWEQSRRGRIPTVRLGRYRRYRREAIEAWLAALER